MSIISARLFHVVVYEGLQESSLLHFSSKLIGITSRESEDL
jgi:hypothetical protein